MADEPLIPMQPMARNSFLGGVLLCALGLGLGYFFLYRPLHALQTTGQMTYSLKGVMLAPLCVYLGALAFTGKFRDGSIRKLNEKGKPTFTKQGWIAITGALVVIGITFACWYGYLHSIGGVQSGPAY